MISVYWFTSNDRKIEIFSEIIFVVHFLVTVIKQPVNCNVQYRDQLSALHFADSVEH